MENFSELQPGEIQEAIRSGLDANPCSECDDEGQVECGDSSNDPDQRTWVDDCPKCMGSGDAECPSCGNPAAFLVQGDGRCIECRLYDQLEEIEYVRSASLDESGSHAGAA